MSRTRWSLASSMLVFVLMFVAAPSPLLNASGDPEILDAFGVLDPFSIAHIDGTVMSDYDSTMFWLDGVPTSAYLYTDGSFEIDTWLEDGYHLLAVSDEFGMSDTYELWIE